MTFNENTARTIMPSTPTLPNFAAYNLAFTLLSGGVPVEEERHNSNLNEPIYLSPGAYNLVVTAYKDAAKTLLMAQGIKTNIVINAGQNTSVSVTLAALDSGGTGTFDWKISLPSDVTSATMTIAPAAGGGTNQTVNLISDGTGTKDLNSGQYNITINMEKPISGDLNKKLVWKELLYVYQNLESVLTIAFTEAHFIQQNYTVTYVSNGGSTIGEQTVLHGGTATNSTPTKSGTSAYTFGGWYTDNGFDSGVYNNAYDFTTKVIDHTTLYARWYSNVQFNNNGGNGSAAQTPNEGVSITLPSADGFSRSGFTFDGWNTQTNGAGTHYAAGETIIPTGNVTIYPRWKCTITFNGNNNSTGAAPAAMTAYANNSITLPGANGMTRTGYSFYRWNTTAVGGGTDYAAASTYSTPTGGNTTLYAKWSCTITYNSNGGSGSISQVTAYNSINVTLSNGSGFSRSSYALVGWKTTASGTSVNYARSATYTPSGNVTLYAHWARTTYSYSNSTTRLIRKTGVVNDNITSEFVIADLQSAGYTGFTIAVSFEVWQQQDAWVRSCVHPGHITNTGSTVNGPTSGNGGISSSAWGGIDRQDPQGDGAVLTISYSVTRALTSFQNTFTVQTDVYSSDAGDNDDRHQMRNLNVTVTAY